MDFQARSPNRLLASLSCGNFDLLASRLRTIELVHGTELVESGSDLVDAYFPHSGLISLVVRLIEGEATEIAIVGRESVFGASAALGGPKALTTAIVHSPGTCSAISVCWLREAADRSKTLRILLARHEQAIFVQARQSAGCLASHPAIARFARWLMRARDAAGNDELQFTQEFIAQMLGVKRNAVSQVSTVLQERGLIRVARGRILIVDAAQLVATACECYGIVREELEDLKRRTFT